MKIKNRKKSLFFTMFSAAAVAGAAVSLALTLTSCNSQKTSENLVVPTANNSDFTNLNSQGGLTSVLASVLSTKEGRQSVATTAANKILSSWFENINNPTLQADYQEWQENAEKSYQNKYDDYKKNKGSNWKQLFQIEVLDPVGGTKESYIQDQINQNLQTTFINNLFAKNYEGVSVADKTTRDESASSTSRTIQAINSGSAAVVNDSNNINGLEGPGTKNAFVFSAETISPSNRQSVDYGYADFMEFLMDEWVYNELPIPVVMSLWKNGDKPAESGLFDDSYFGKSNVGETGSYNFQYFTPASANAQEMTTTTKYQLLVKNLNKFVNTTTGVIDLPTIYTEDSSTQMTIKADNLFDGTIATPFSAAAWYKLTSSVFGNTESNMATSETLDPNSIMKNFIYDGTSDASTGTSYRNKSVSKEASIGVFSFPYLNAANAEQKSSDSPFAGEYAGMTGIKDTVNLVKSSSGVSTATTATTQEQESTNEAISNFIITRDSFGVHLIGIDRLSQIIKATTSTKNGNKQSGTETNLQKYQKMVTEIRNTFMYRAAQDIVKNQTNYKLQDSLKTYLQNNFSNLIIKYASRLVQSTDTKESTDTNKYNLFGALVMDNKAWDPATSKEGTEDNSPSENYNKFKQVLSILDPKFPLVNFINFSNNLDNAKRTLKFANNIKQQMYSAQSNYNDTTTINQTNHEGWRKYGIAGVMPYTRDSQTGNFTNLIKPVNDLISEVKFTTGDASSNEVDASNKAKRNSFNADSLTISVDDNAAGQKDTDFNNSKNAYTLVLGTKLQFMQSIVDMLNEGSTQEGMVTARGQSSNGQVAPTSYIFTNDDYVNGAIEAVSKNSHLSTIIQNLYSQNYLTFQNKVDDTTTKVKQSLATTQEDDSTTTTAKSAFYDFADNQINVDSGKEAKNNEEGSTQDVKQSIQNAINSNYIINNFKNLPNLYYDGDWTSLNSSTTGQKDNSQSVYSIAHNAWMKSWVTSQYTFRIGNDLVVGYEDPTSASSYQKFLITLEYLFTYNPDNGGSFSFKNLQDFLKEMTANNNRAMVAWVANSSIVGNPDFGIQGNQNNNSSYANADSVRTEVQKDFNFSGNPIYLDKLTPYSYYGAPNAFQNTKEADAASSSTSTSTTGLTNYNYTTSSNYWNAASMTNPSTTGGAGKSVTQLSTGFLGFQVNNASDFGMSNSITSDAFNNSTYSVSASLGNESSNYNYQGVLYQYGTGKQGRANLIEQVKNMSTINQLVDFYNNVLIASNLPITQDSKDAVQKIIDTPNSNQTDKITELSNKLVEIINSKQVPENAFNRLNAMPLWNDSALGVTSTLFADGSSSSMYNEYVVTLFNEQDVNNLVKDGKLNTKTSSTSTVSKKDGELTDSTDEELGYLGLTKDAFYSAVVMLAANNTELQDKAMKAMLKDIGKIKVYDMRLATSLDSAWISNYGAWEKVINATSSSSDSSN